MIWGSVERPAVICVGMPVYDTPEQAMIRSFHDLILPGRGLAGRWFKSETSGVLIDDARNAIAKEALEQKDMTHLLFIDSDMTFPPDSLIKLLVQDKDVIGGLYFQRREPYAPMVMKFGSGDRLLDPVPYPEDTVYGVDATGCGFMLIQRWVLEAIGENPFEKANGVSEDFSFCLRAKHQAKAGVYVHTGCKLGHIGKVVIDEEFVRRL